MPQHTFNKLVQKFSSTFMQVLVHVCVEQSSKLFNERNLYKERLAQESMSYAQVLCMSTYTRFLNMCRGVGVYVFCHLILMHTNC